MTQAQSESPSHGEWDDLLQVCEHLGSIIEDAESLNMLARMMHFAGTSEDSRLAVLARRETAQDAPASTFESRWVRHLCVVLPGVEKLGTSRTQRLHNLKDRLPELPAYRWLVSQQPYSAALRMMVAGQVAARKPAFAKDTAEFLLIRAIGLPLASFLAFTRSPGFIQYPTADALRSIAAAAEGVHEFLSTHRGLCFSEWLPWKAEEDARALRDALQTAAEKYQRQPATLVEMKKRTAVAFAKGLRFQFGQDSTAVVVELAKLIDYNIEASNVRAVMRELDGVTRKPERPKQASITPEPDAPKASWMSGLGQLVGRPKIRAPRK